MAVSCSCWGAPGGDRRGFYWAPRGLSQSSYHRGESRGGCLVGGFDGRDQTGRSPHLWHRRGNNHPGFPGSAVGLVAIASMAAQRCQDGSGFRHGWKRLLPHCSLVSLRLAGRADFPLKTCTGVDHLTREFRHQYRDDNLDLHDSGKCVHVCKSPGGAASRRINLAQVQERYLEKNPGLIAILLRKYLSKWTGISLKRDR
jgi:hypothetical protein